MSAYCTAKDTQDRLNCIEVRRFGWSLKDIDLLLLQRLDAWAGRFSEQEKARLEEDGWFTPVLIGCGAILLIITIIFLLRRLWKRCHKNSRLTSVPFKPLKSIEIQGLVVVPVEKV
ncbi:hypothetical protein MAR_021869 [Mya arenaria]|uniref:Uncharacterized protein n=1 Tax=Mya arenaria TaxID=6604 RepID=A0ABY7E8Z7_MYAAR|nr:hypothetical protein MAR_021869 [Mya arenaria]